jgi:hypothetical protein
VSIPAPPLGQTLEEEYHTKDSKKGASGFQPKRRAAKLSVFIHCGRKTKRNELFDGGLKKKKINTFFLSKLLEGHIFFS